MALTQYRQGSTYYGYDPDKQQAIAFSDPTQFQKYFQSFDANAPAPTFDTSKITAANQFFNLASAQPSVKSTLPDISKLEADYKNYLSPSRDELKAQQDLNNLIASTRQGYTNIDNKVIPMEFITGQARALEQRSTDLAIPLQQKLALLQAKRQTGLEASRFSLERADRQAELAKEQAKSNPLSNGFPFYKYPGSAQTFDAKTNQPINYEQYKSLGGIGQPGMDVWGDIYEVGGSTQTVLNGRGA